MLSCQTVSHPDPRIEVMFLIARVMYVADDGEAVQLVTKKNKVWKCFGFVPDEDGIVIHQYLSQLYSYFQFIRTYTSCIKFISL